MLAWGNDLYLLAMHLSNKIGDRRLNVIDFDFNYYFRTYHLICFEKKIVCRLYKAYS